MKKPIAGKGLFCNLPSSAAHLLLVLAASALPAQARQFDVLIRGGTVIDGTGTPGVIADVGIIGDTIAAVGRLDGSTAKQVVEARGRLVTPGFIDTHAHLDGEDGLDSEDPRRRAAQNYVTQGITTALINPDGRQPASLPAQRAKYERTGIGLNVALANGHNSLREMTMGKNLARTATAEEIARMREILRRGLAEEGSFGLTLGLEYFSGLHSVTDEVVELARELPAYNGIFIPHMRSQGSSPRWYKPSVHRDIMPPTMDDSLIEVFRVASETGATVVITHLKVRGPGSRGEGVPTVEKIKAIRAQGARVYADVYPYNSTGSDGSFVALPPWAVTAEPGREGDGGGPRDYRPALRRIIADPAKLADLKRDVEHEVALKGGAANIRVLDHPDQKQVGRTLAEMMEEKKMDLTQMAIALQLEGDPTVPGGARLRSFSLAEQDVETFYAQPWVATSTDGQIVLPEEAVGARKYIGTNQRHFGSFPKRLAHYARDRKIESIEETVRKCTSFPAELLSIRDRGRIAPGNKADINVIDLANLRDNTTPEEPSVYATGLDYVFVNGVAVVSNGQRTLALPGRVLKPAWMAQN